VNIITLNYITVYYLGIQHITVSLCVQIISADYSKYTRMQFQSNKNTPQ